MKKWIIVLFTLLLPTTALADGWVYAGTTKIETGAKFSSDTGNIIRDTPSPKGAEVARLRAGQVAKVTKVVENYGHYWVEIEFGAKK